MFMIILIVVDLPAPLGPSRPKTSPSRAEKRDAIDGLELAEALSHVAKLDHTQLLPRTPPGGLAIQSRRRRAPRNASRWENGPRAA